MRGASFHERALKSVLVDTLYRTVVASARRIRRAILDEELCTKSQAA